MCRTLVKHVDLGERTSFLDCVCLGYIQTEYKPNESMVDDNSEMFESRMYAGATAKLLESENLVKNVFAWSHDMR